VWQVVRHIDIIPKAEAEFQHLFEHLLKIREGEALRIGALERELDAIKASEE